MKNLVLTNELKTKFEEDGYLILENFFTPEQCDAMRDECKRIINEMDPEEHKEVFSTDAHEQMKSDYLLNSSDKIRYFWEVEAKDKEGKLLRPKHLALNKIGHALHALCPAFKAATFDERISDLLRQLRFVRPVVPQSMYIFKSPGIGGEVNRHIDSTFLYSDPLKLLGLWIALEDATEENGCLWFAKGSHKKTDVTYRMVRNPIEGGLPRLVFEGSMEPIPFEEYTVTPVKRGSLVLIDGKVHHYSKKNTSDKSRNIYTFHVTESYESKWCPRNWLQPSTALPFPAYYDDSSAAE